MGKPERTKTPNKARDRVKSIEALKSSAKTRKSVDDANDNDLTALLAVQIPWAVLSHEQIKEVLSITDHELFIKKLASFVALDRYKSDLKCTVHSQLQSYDSYARSNSFLPHQVGCLLYLIRTIIIGITDKKIALDEIISEIKMQIIALSKRSVVANTLFVSLPEGVKIHVLEGQVSRLVGNYISQTLFQHFKLLSYVLTKEQDEETQQLSILVPSPYIFPPLKEAMTESAYKLMKKEELRQEKLNEQKKLAEEIAQDPFKYLSVDQVEEITSRYIQSSLQKFQQDVIASVNQPNVEINNTTSTTS